jgi:hypothetical protein
MKPRWCPVVGEKVKYLGRIYTIEVVNHSRALNLYIRNGGLAHRVSHLTVWPLDLPPVQKLPEYNQFDLERSLNRLRIAGRAVKIADALMAELAK